MNGDFQRPMCTDVRVSMPRVPSFFGFCLAGTATRGQYDRHEDATWKISGACGSHTYPTKGYPIPKVTHLELALVFNSSISA